MKNTSGFLYAGEVRPKVESPQRVDWRDSAAGILPGVSAMGREEWISHSHPFLNPGRKREGIMSAPSKKRPGNVIFRPYITLPDGRVIYAKDYGKKAFPIPVAKGER